MALWVINLSLQFGWNTKSVHIILFYLTRLRSSYFGVSQGALQFMAYKELKKDYSQYCGTPINEKLVNTVCTCLYSWHVLKLTNSTELPKQKLLILNLDKQEHVKCFDSDHIHSLGLIIKVLSFIGKKLFSQLPSPPRRIDNNQPFAPPPPQDWPASNFSLQYHLWITRGGHENRRNIQPSEKFLTV